MAELRSVPGSVCAPRGFRAAGVAAGIKPSGNPDVALILSGAPATAAAVFTTNRVCAAPVVVTQAIAKNQFLVGDFQNGAYILDREDANVRMSDSHADYFTANMVAILAEERIGVAVPRPKFFNKGTWTAGA